MLSQICQVHLDNTHTVDDVGTIFNCLEEGVDLCLLPHLILLKCYHDYIPNIVLLLMRKNSAFVPRFLSLLLEQEPEHKDTSEDDSGHSKRK